MKLPIKKYKIVMSAGTTEEVEGKIFQYMLLPKHSFGIRKEKEFWVVDHIPSGRSCNIMEKTETAAFDALMNLLKDKNKVEVIKRACSIKQSLDNISEYRTLIKRLEEITKLDIPVYGGLGINIIKLDKMIQTPEGVSTLQHFKNTFGEEASNILEKIASFDMIIEDGKIIKDWVKTQW